MKPTSIFVIAESAFMKDGNVVSRGTKVELEPGIAYNLVQRGKAKLVEGQELTASTGYQENDNEGPNRQEILDHLKGLTKDKLVQFAKDNAIDVDEKANKDEILAVVQHAVEENYKAEDEE